MWNLRLNVLFFPFPINILLFYLSFLFVIIYLQYAFRIVYSTCSVIVGDTELRKLEKYNLYVKVKNTTVI